MIERTKKLLEDYHKALQEVQRERNALRAENEELKEKLAQAQKTIEIQKMSNDALIDENLDYRYDITDTAYEQAKYMAESWKEDYQQEIEELKQQLVQSEKENAELHTAINMSIPNQIAMRGEIERLHTCVDNRIAELVEKNEQLKQQLDEKNQQIESYKHTIYMNMLNQEMLELKVAKQDQDKISFAVEQINKLKNDLDNNDKIIIRYCDFEEFDNIFEKRITELTHQHEDKGE